jgi:hypothetical protein
MFNDIRDPRGPADLDAERQLRRREGGPLPRLRE